MRASRQADGNFDRKDCGDGRTTTARTQGCGQRWMKGRRGEDAREVPTLHGKGRKSCRDKPRIRSMQWGYYEMGRHSVRQGSLQRVVNDELARRAELEWDRVE